MRKLLLLFVSVLVLSTADAADNSSQDFSSQHLREIIVEYPDSVLAILDRAEQMRPQSLPQFRIDLLRGLAYNEKRMYSLVEHFASAALASDSIDSYPNEKLNAQTLLYNRENETYNFQKRNEQIFSFFASFFLWFFRSLKHQLNAD